MMNYEVTGAKRKEMVQIIAEMTGEKAVYQGMPTAAYKVGAYTIDRIGTVTPDLPREIIEELTQKGFTAQGASEEPTGAEEEKTGLIIDIPLEKLTPNQITNFGNMVESKGTLIMQAFDIDSLPVEMTEENLSIRWFENKEATPELLKTGASLISAMLKKAGEQKYVSAKAVPADNPKYNFRVFLNSLGFAGAEFKGFRKILLKNLAGNSAFRHPSEV